MENEAIRSHNEAKQLLILKNEMGSIMKNGAAVLNASAQSRRSSPGREPEAPPG